MAPRDILPLAAVAQPIKRVGTGGFEQPQPRLALVRFESDKETLLLLRRQVKLHLGHTLTEGAVLIDVRISLVNLQLVKKITSSKSKIEITYRHVEGAEVV